MRQSGLSYNATTKREREIRRGFSTRKGSNKTVIRLSTGASTGKVICYAALSTAAFTVSTGNTLKKAA